MARTRIDNVTTQILPLPVAFGWRLVRPGAGIVVALSQTATLALLGGQDAADGIWRLTETPDGDVVTPDVDPATLNATQIQGIEVSTTDPADGQMLAYSLADVAYVPTTPSSGVSLTSDAAVALGSAAVGNGTTAARSNHVHPTTGLATLAAENTFTQRQLFDGGALINAGQVLTFQTGSNSVAINQGAHTFASARTVYFPDASGEIDITGAAQTATARKTFAAGLVPFVGTVAEINAIGSPTVGLEAFATDGRVGAEGAGLGTGCPVYYGAGQWRRYEDGAQVAA